MHMQGMTIAEQIKLQTAPKRRQGRQRTGKPIVSRKIKKVVEKAAPEPVQKQSSPGRNPRLAWEGDVNFVMPAGSFCRKSGTNGNRLVCVAITPAISLEVTVFDPVLPIGKLAEDVPVVGTLRIFRGEDCASYESVTLHQKLHTVGKLGLMIADKNAIMHTDDVYHLTLGKSTLVARRMH